MSGSSWMMGGGRMEIDVDVNVMRQARAGYAFRSISPNLESASPLQLIVTTISADSRWNLVCTSVGHAGGHG